MKDIPGRRKRLRFRRIKRSPEEGDFEKLLMTGWPMALSRDNNNITSVVSVIRPKIFLKVTDID